MKNIPLKIFVIILIAGIICVVGDAVLTVDIITLSDGYTEITDEFYENTLDATNIKMLLHRHQSLVANHVVATDEKKFSEYESEAAEIEGQLRDTFAKFGKRMTGGEREQIYHKAYTDFLGYLESSQNAINFSRENSVKMAEYYVVTVMDGYVADVNKALDNLDEFTSKEINAAKEKMQSYIKLSVVEAVISIAVIIVSVVFTSIYCFRITSNLDKYKDDLEKDIEAKNAALQAHNEKMLRIQNNTIIGMANLIESRDGDTGEHVKRTSVYVYMLANAAKKAGYHTEILTDDYIELLMKAAPLHDIGKITVSDTILNKPGRLTPEEFETMKLHAVNGGKIVREVIGGIEETEYVEIAADVAAYHHEKWDGSGYNKGLSGEDIPLCARIMALADVFDALISKRCYKSEMPVDEAFKLIEEEAGSHFDPALTKIFLSLRNDIEDYLNGNDTVG